MSAATVRRVLALAVAALVVLNIGAAVALVDRAQHVDEAPAVALDAGPTPTTSDPWSDWCDPAYRPDADATTEVCGRPGPGPYTDEGATCPYVVGRRPSSWYYDCTDGARPADELEQLAAIYHQGKAQP